MPRAPKRCGHDGCDQLVVARTYCETHTVPWKGSNRPGSTRASRRLRQSVLLRDIVCTCDGCPRCTGASCQRRSTEDDHLVNLAAGGSDDVSNHAGKCAPCHRWKTQREANGGQGAPHGT